MNTGLLRPAVATAPTVYGIETVSLGFLESRAMLLQQHLPFTVLKPPMKAFTSVALNSVATAPTVYGIETHRICIFAVSECRCNSTYRLRY